MHDAVGSLLTCNCPHRGEEHGPQKGAVAGPKNPAQQQGAAPAPAQKAAEDAVTGHARLRLFTLCSRLEMYVSRDLWPSLTR